MEIILPGEVKAIAKKVTNAGFQVYLVGGAVRDMLMGKDAKDFDFTTNATPEEIKALFENAFYDNIYGTVGVPTENFGTVEITTFRSEKGYSNNRHPDEVSWGKTIEEDLERRDFTINALAIQIDDGMVKTEKIIDLYDGKKDLK